MVEGSCHCGAVRIEVACAPEEVTECNCSICRRNGTLWAYYRPAEVSIEGPTETYVWGDRMLALHRCGTCGCVTHWRAFDEAYDRMGVHARLFDPEVLAAARIRKVDNA
jgi:hypothetical protein